MFNYYVYVYLDPRKKCSNNLDGFQLQFEPFYVGKGKGRRYNLHLLAAKNGKDCKNKYKYRKIRSILKAGLEPIIIKIKEDLLEQDAFNKEIEFINILSKQFNLTNLTKGGDGISGYKHRFESKVKSKNSHSKIWTKEKRKQQSEIMKAAIKPEDVKRRVALRKERDNYKQTEKSRKSISNSVKILWENSDYRNKVLETRKTSLVYLNKKSGKVAIYTPEEARIRKNEQKRERRRLR